MSSSGQYMIGCRYGGGIYISSTYGDSWNITTAPTSEDWFDVAMSSSGQYMIGCIYGEGIYISSTYGDSWVQTSAPNNIYWTFVAMSSSGQYIVAGGLYNLTFTFIPLYFSSNWGKDWNTTGTPTPWTDGAISWNGQYTLTIEYLGGTGTGNYLFLSKSGNPVPVVTNYQTNNIDLGTIFAPYVAGNQVVTNYKTNNIDLGTLFAPYSSIFPTFGQNWVTTSSWKSRRYNVFS